MSDLNAMTESLKALEKDAEQLFAQLVEAGADPRRMALAKTKLEEAVLWAQKAVTPEWFAVEGKQIHEA